MPATKLFPPLVLLIEGLFFFSSMRAQFAETQHRKIKTLQRFNYKAAVSMEKRSMLVFRVHIVTGEKHSLT